MKEPQITTLAENLLERFQQKKAPVDVERIAEGLGIVVKRGDLGENTSGVIYREGNATVVGINSTQSKVRQRFTLAHEIGHFIIHKQRDLWVDSPVLFRRNDVTGAPLETEANRFAADLLMPRNLLSKMKADQNAPALIQDMAKEYNVSVAAMSIRLVDLQLIPQY